MIRNMGTLFRAAQELTANPRNEAFHALVAEVREYPGVKEACATDFLPSSHSPILPLQLSVSGQTIHLHSAITTIGTPLDVTAQELRIESFFPADKETDEFISALTG